jgi:class 3 adenylate cyclase
VGGLKAGFADAAWGFRSIDGHAPAGSPENRENFVRLSVRLGVPLVLVGILSAVVIPTAVGENVRHGPLLSAVLASLLVVGVPLVTLGWRTLPLWAFHIPALLAVAAISVVAYFGGPAISTEVGAVYVASTSLSLIAFTRAVAAVYGLTNAIGYAVVLAAQHEGDPGAKWFGVVAMMLIIASAMDWTVNRLRTLAERERATRAELAALNATLEVRVAEQVEEIGRISRLRRFLSPQVADVVLDAGGSRLLEPHRRRIAVFFCVLRGFTRFVGGAEPEEVVEILDEYYRLVGSVINEYAATVGQFAGDGIMAYLNDPVPCDDPCARAVRMALALRGRMTEVIPVWTGRGFELGFGIGIAYGYATLGTIGFEGRSEYTPVGSVVNLAARLCSEAASGEILIDERAHDAIDGLDRSINATPITVQLKGFPDPVTAFRVGGTTACFAGGLADL